MRDIMMKRIERIVVMGGAGHIGLPLGLLLAKADFRVTLYDIDEAALKTIAKGKVPFREDGGEDLLRSLLPPKCLNFSTGPACIGDADAIVSAIGTPVDEHLNPTLPRFIRTMKSIYDYLRDGQLLVLRSTVAPGTCTYLDDQLHAEGKCVHLAYCPERIVEGRALEEIPVLPQIVSGMSPEAVAGAREIFEKLGPEILELTPAEAELSKLFVNVWRYLKFAISNQFYMIANDRGLDFEKILHSIRHNYQRGADIPQPGFAAGPCLFKDTMQLAASFHSGFQLGHAGMIINEGLPNYLVQRLKLKFRLHEMTVGILGMAFKAESDDIRESLSYKVRKLLLIQGAEVLCADPYVPDPSFIPAEELVDRSDLIIVGAPHRLFSRLDTKNKHVVDVWNLFGGGRTV
jgi:UDP-N-acetyl-D-mannosaminuronic acid dehydrogenase